jgi:hypothetical protein
MKVTSVTIFGRRWFNPSKGHSYFSATGLINGEFVCRVDYESGNGSEYEYSMFRELASKVDLKETNPCESPYTWCQRMGVTYYSECVDVRRRKDLK